MRDFKSEMDQVEDRLIDEVGRGNPMYRPLLRAMTELAEIQRQRFGHSNEGRALSIFLTDLEKLVAWVQYQGMDNFSVRIGEMDIGIDIGIDNGMDSGTASDRA